MINIKHTKHYEYNIFSNKLEYSTAAGVYCTTPNVKVPFYMPEFSSSKIINRRFHIDNDKGESGIGYNMFIVGDLMLHLGLADDFSVKSFNGMALLYLIRRNLAAC